MKMAYYVTVIYVGYMPGALTTIIFGHACICTCMMIVVSIAGSLVAEELQISIMSISGETLL